MLELFPDDAELAFVGPSVGPFHGREAIAVAYEAQPPDDAIRLLDERREGEELVAGYAWAREAPKRAGDLRLTARDGTIARLVVTFD
jgi:steroid Delta-isomerase